MRTQRFSGRLHSSDIHPELDIHVLAFLKSQQAGAERACGRFSAELHTFRTTHTVLTRRPTTMFIYFSALLSVWGRVFMGVFLVTIVIHEGEGVLV